MVVSNRPGRERRREEGRKKIRCRSSASFSKWRSVWVMFETCAAHCQAAYALTMCLQTCICNDLWVLHGAVG